MRGETRRPGDESLVALFELLQRFVG